MLFTCIFAACFFAITRPATITAHASTPTVAFSQMSEDDCVDFIVESGAIIPNEFVGNPELGEFVKHIIQSVEANPDYPIAFNNNVSYRFAEDIRAIVLDHLGLYSSFSTSYMTTISSMATTSSNLLQNEFYYWENGFKKVNK